MEEAVVAEMAIVLEDALFCLQCLPLLASDKLTLEHRTSKTRRSRKTLEWMAGWLAPRVMGCGKHAKKIQHIPLGKWKGFVTGRSGRTNCRYRTREKGPPIPSCPTPLHPNINKATNLSSLVFAIMYMAKIVVTGQELLSKLTVSSLGWKLGWHAENIGHSNTTKGQGMGESACLSSQDLREGRKAGSTDLLRHMLFFPFEVSESSAQIKEL
uniref:Uncharacterized protein n=1 Tax=Oryza glumipatula TaxID=40148 RepID=A0A0E0A378_9ORYZ